MVQSMIDAENGTTQGANKNKEFKEVWEVFHSLPYELAIEISHLLEEREAKRPSYDWSILLIVAANKTQRNIKSVRLGPFKLHVDDLDDEIKAAYVVLKYEDRYLGSYKADSRDEFRENSSKVAAGEGFDFDETEPQNKDIEPLERRPPSPSVQSTMPRPTVHDRDMQFHDIPSSRTPRDGPEPRSAVSFAENTKSYSGTGPSFVRGRARPRTQSQDKPSAQFHGQAFHDVPAPIHDYESYYPAPDRYFSADDREQRPRFRPENPALRRTSAVPIRTAHPEEDPVYLEQVFPGPYGPSFDPNIGPYRMPPPSGIYDSRRQRYDSLQNTSLVPYRRWSGSRWRRQSPVVYERVSRPVNITDRIYNEPEELGGPQRPMYRSRAPEYGQDVNEYNDPILRTRRISRNEPVAIPRSSAPQRDAIRERDLIFEREYQDRRMEPRYYDDSDDRDINVREKREIPVIVREPPRHTKRVIQVKKDRKEPRIVEEEDHKLEEEIADRLVAKLTNGQSKAPNDSQKKKSLERLREKEKETSKVYESSYFTDSESLKDNDDAEDSRPPLARSRSNASCSSRSSSENKALVPPPVTEQEASRRYLLSISR